MKINLIVLKTKQPKALMEQYLYLGLKFDFHQHGSGPFHYTTEINNQVFEIYPLPQSKLENSCNLRLGFEIPNLERTMNNIENSSWKVLSSIKQTQWGLQALIQDLDGRKIELNQA